MSKEGRVTYQTGATLKAELWSLDRSTRWNGTAMVAPSTIAAAAFATGLLTVTESKYSDATTGTTTYTVDLPAGLASTVASYYFLFYDNPSAAGEDAVCGYEYHHNGASGEATELTTTTAVATLGGYVDTEIAAIKLKTDLLVTFPANFTDLSISSEDGYVKATTDTGAGIATAANLAALTTTVGVAGLGLSAIPKTGFKLASDGLDSISITAPTGVASNFREMVVQTWRRFFKKTTRDGSNIKTFADDGTTAITTQPYTSVDPNETVGPAS